MMRLILRVMAISGAAVAVAVLTVALVSADTEPTVRAIVLDGAIDLSLADPMPTTGDGAQPPPAAPAIEQIEPAPTPSPPMPVADPLAARPEVTFIPPADEPGDPADGTTDDLAEEPVGDDDSGSDGDEPDD
jgi:hypothetical protein